MASDTLANCPKCNAPVGSETLECAQCGILISKWQEREENVQTGNVSKYSATTATSSGFNWTILAIICAVIIAVLIFLERSQ